MHADQQRRGTRKERRASKVPSKSALLGQLALLPPASGCERRALVGLLANPMHRIVILCVTRDSFPAPDAKRQLWRDLGGNRAAFATERGRLASRNLHKGTPNREMPNKRTVGVPSRTESRSSGIFSPPADCNTPPARPPRHGGRSQIKVTGQSEKKSEKKSKRPNQSKPK